jgi:hypothetical protein
MTRPGVIALAALIFLLPAALRAEGEEILPVSDATSDEGPADAAAQDALPELPAASRAEPATSLPEAVRPSIRAWVDRKKINLGETVRLMVAIRRRPDQELRLPMDVSFGKLDLLDKTVKTTQEEGGWKKDLYAFNLIALVPGAVEIPPLRFGGITKSGDVVYLDTNGVLLTVVDPTAGKVDAKIKDVTPVVKVYEKNLLLLYFLGAVAVVFLVLALVWYLARNWERWHPRAPLAPPPPRPPEETAYEKLRALRAAIPLDRDSKKKWYIDLSEVMREYLANRFDFDGLESTSEEIIEFMKMRKTVGVTQAELWKFLVSCDMVKFARVVPPVDEALRIVDATTLRQEASRDDAAPAPQAGAVVTTAGRSG